MFIRGGTYSMAERDRRWANIRRMMSENGYDCLILPKGMGDGINFLQYAEYVSNSFFMTPGAVVFPLEGEPAVIGAMPSPNPWIQQTTRKWFEGGREALAALVGRLEEGQTGLVFTHGGLIELLLWPLLGLPIGRRRLGFLSNTSFCELAFDGEAASILRYNDAAHLGPVSYWADFTRDGGGIVVDLIRHGVTQANLERRAQGRVDSDLHPEGREQARRLASWIGKTDEVFSSTLRRAASTAEIAFGRPPVLVDELVEMSFGEWEGELWEELEASGRLGGYPHDGQDIRRGGTGETWSEVQDRVSGFISSLTDTYAGRRVAAASHGGAIKAYSTAILGFDYGKAGSLGPLENTSVTQVAITPDGYPTLATYNITHHLEDRED